MLRCLDWSSLLATDNPLLDLILSYFIPELHLILSVITTKNEIDVFKQVGRSFGETSRVKVSSNVAISLTDRSISLFHLQKIVQ